MKPVYSFDVFDTVLTRNVYRPADLFLRIQGALLRADPGELPEEVRRDYRNIRIAAESTARQRLVGREEVTLREILAVIAWQYDLSDAAVARLEEIEIGEELASVVPVGPAAALLRSVRQGGGRVNYVSDMYLPDRVIEAMLSKVKQLEPGDGVFVSGTRGVKKSTGSLFREVLDELRLEPGELLHVGDYLWSDWLVPRLKHRIRALPARAARDNVYERLWGDPCRCLYCSSLAGASRAARLALTGEEAPLEAELYRLGCNVLGPLLVGFTLWTLREALRSGIRRLYFLSRDGEVILDVARDLAARLGIGIELRYLKVSRTAVFPALMGAGIRAETIEWLREPTIVPTVRILADRAKVEQATLHRELLRLGAAPQDLDAPLDEPGLARICELLVADPALNRLLATSGEKARRYLEGYLHQEGLFDRTPVGLVDLGWHGGIQDALHACFDQRFGEGGLSGFYFGVDLPGTGRSRKSGYFLGHRESGDFRRCRHLFRILIELLCSGSHGMVRGYSPGGSGDYLPQCGEPEHPMNWERIDQVRRGCRAFLSALDARSVADCDYRHVRPQMLSVFKKLFFFPSREEAGALGGLYFSADQTGHGLHQVSPPFTQASAVRYLTKRSYAGRSLVSSWFFASWIRSGLATRLLLYPLVWLLRTRYVGRESRKFLVLRCLDSINALIHLKRA